MKILVVSNFYPPAITSGYEFPCKQLCGDLIRRGHDVSLLTTPVTAQNDSKHLRGLNLRTPFLSEHKSPELQTHSVVSQNEAITCRAVAETKPDIVFLWSQRSLTGDPGGFASFSLDHTELVRVSENTLVYPAGDGEALTVALKRCAAGRTLSHRAPENSGRAVEEQVSLEGCVDGSEHPLTEPAGRMAA